MPKVKGQLGNLNFMSLGKGFIFPDSGINVKKKRVELMGMSEPKARSILSFYFRFFSLFILQKDFKLKAKIFCHLLLFSSSSRVPFH